MTLWKNQNNLKFVLYKSQMKIGLNAIGKVYWFILFVVCFKTFERAYMKESISIV